MLEIAIPGHRELRLEHLVLDYNGTLACDGELIEGVGPSLKALAKDLEIHVVTADTFGKVKSRMEGSPCKVVVLPQESQDFAKLEYVEQLGAEGVVAIGNGRNDRLMLKRATLGIAVVQEEGAAAETMLAADVVCPTIRAALDLLRNPLRLTATLRA
jgi:soluble P-type ATPase